MDRPDEKEPEIFIIFSLKKTILHIINNLGRGGAETMLVTVIKELDDYYNIVVTLSPQDHFKDELKCDKYYCLNLSSIARLPLAVPKLKKIIKDNNVDLVHSHLFWPTVLARMATPKKVGLITTIHTFIASSEDYKKWYIRFLDRLTYRFHKNIIVSVAKGALDEYFMFLKVKPYKIYVLYTFVDIRIFNPANESPVKKNEPVFKMVTVGALRKQKNHTYILEAFKELDNKQVQFDIYGEGPFRNELEKIINSNKLNVNLKGEVHNIEKVINKYNLYVMSSTFEGFSLSVLEAMAMRVPLLLSDIPSFREQCADTAVYFSLDDVADFKHKLESLASDTNRMNNLAEAAYARVVNNFTLEQHMQGLRKIYEDALNNS
jgi:glycosyltransferase involved in cell wall biosynthesis